MTYEKYDEERLNLIIHMGENGKSQEWLDAQIANLDARFPEHAQRFEQERQARANAPWNQPRKEPAFIDLQEGDDGAPPER